MSLADALGEDDPEMRRTEMRVLLDDAMQVLSPRDREVLRLRFEEDLTQTEISNRIGVSQMQISRIIRQSLVRLRSGAGERFGWEACVPLGRLLLRSAWFGRRGEGRVDSSGAAAT